MGSDMPQWVSVRLTSEASRWPCVRGGRAARLRSVCQTGREADFQAPLTPFLKPIAEAVIVARGPLTELRSS